MEKIFLESGVLGACVLAGGGFIVWLIKYMLDENSKREERHSQEIAVIHKENAETIDKIQNTYKEELNKTQSVFLASMDKIVSEMSSMNNRMSVVEETVKDIEIMLK